MNASSSVIKYLAAVMLHEGSKLFNVLLLKTNMTIPYTSVFLQLDCGYWDAEKEARLRGG